VTPTPRRERAQSDDSRLIGVTDETLDLKILVVVARLSSLFGRPDRSQITIRG